MTDYRFNLQVVLEGLKVMCGDHEERLAHFSKAGATIDENFDFIVLDYLAGAASAGLIPKETAYGIESLFKPLTCQQQDALMKERPEIVREWQERMAIYIKQIEAHNNRLQSKND